MLLLLPYQLSLFLLLLQLNIILAWDQGETVLFNIFKGPKALHSFTNLPPGTLFPPFGTSNSPPPSLYGRLCTNAKASNRNQEDGLALKVGR